MPDIEISNFIREHLVTERPNIHDSGMFILEKPVRFLPWKKSW